ncbi:hypothetical protein PX699_18455 [Sphingobium sp. H39-3-25]|uniref:hypothetical protein n=1 Tax=Sphingobium arseniciresistens TaxID=3030834 RepID=UPI0023BA12DD|nr:hypothetical protein [Sphingobium arseniciresistens]|tara:strand:- start:30527 stop:30970 length:444 start_codon:yes stop_codon:yes gene_type:complete
MVNPGSPLYGPKHVRELLDIDTERLRNWRKLLPAIGSERGRQSVFDFVDLFALALVRRLVIDLEIRVGLLEPVAEQLVDLCRSVTLDEASHLRLEFMPEDRKVAIRTISAPPPEALTALVPIGPVLKDLLARLTLPPDGANGLPLFR